MKTGSLTPKDHDRDAAGLTYVYPVVSRRSGGVSIGINLNPNNACDWHCAYCQVPNLVRGTAPEIDLALLERELRGFVHEALHGAFMERYVPEGCRQLRDLAISGNGEPTSSGQFDVVVDLIGRVMREVDLVGAIPLVLISNGSYVGKPTVQRALRTMATLGGEVWFKVDSVTEAGSKRINGVTLSERGIRDKLAACAACCPTWIQTCAVAWDGLPPDEAEQGAYLEFLARLAADRVPVLGVRLYGLARPALQAESTHVSRLTEDWMAGFGHRIEALGLPVRVTP
ncbi:MAG: radical SAM protein [Gammaproteobacteria bacterium]|nr:radical SAM protein [Gammaproteobacteria bacterium]